MTKGAVGEREGEARAGWEPIWPMGGRSSARSGLAGAVPSITGPATKDGELGRVKPSKTGVAEAYVDPALIFSSERLCRASRSEDLVHGAFVDIPAVACGGTTVESPKATWRSQPNWRFDYLSRSCPTRGVCREWLPEPFVDRGRATARPRSPSGPKSLSSSSGLGAVTPLERAVSFSDVSD